MSITYRDASPADADALADIGARTFSETFGHLYDPADLALFLDQHRADKWAAELQDPGFAVRLAEARGTVIGYAKLGPPQLPFEPRGKAAELRQLYVLGPWHGAGVGEQLMHWIVGCARGQGADHLYLSVFVDNHRARRFYERHGFEVEGSYTFMVGTHADEDVVLRLAL